MLKVAFPLAHPAAALALKRAFPKTLCFSGLVIGSIIPDLANCLNWDYFTHSIKGVLLFCTPVGLVSLLIFYRVRLALALTLPSPHRTAAVALCSDPGPRPESASFLLLATLSILLGSLGHIGWDWFTHDHSSFAAFAGEIRITNSSADFSLKVNRVIYVLSTGAGLLWLFAAYRSRVLPFKAANGWWNEPWKWAFWSGLLFGIFGVSLFLTFVSYGPRHDLRFLLRNTGEFSLALTYLALGIFGLLFECRRVRRTPEPRPRSAQNFANTQLESENRLPL